MIQQEDVAGQRAASFILCCIPQVAMVSGGSALACDLPGLINAHKLTFLMCVMVSHDVAFVLCHLVDRAGIMAPLSVRCAKHSANRTHTLVVMVSVNSAGVLVFRTIQQSTILVARTAFQIQWVRVETKCVCPTATMIVSPTCNIPSVQLCCCARAISVTPPHISTGKVGICALRTRGLMIQQEYVAGQ